MRLKTLIPRDPREAADLTLSFFVLATVALLFVYNRKQESILLALAGFASGLAAWTKNEGLLFLITGSFAWLVMLSRQNQWKELKWYALGISLPLAVILYFKLFLTPPNDLFNPATSTNLMERLIDFERYSIIAGNFYGHSIHVFGNGKLSIFFLALYGLIVGLERSSSHKQPAFAAILAIFLQLAGYFLIYVLTPHDLDWHLRTSVYRLMIHVFPSILLLLFASITDPEAIFARAPKPSISRKF